MSHLEQCHPAIKEFLLLKFQDAKNGKTDEVCFEYRDFGGVVYELYNPNDNQKLLMLSIRIPNFADLKKQGVEAFLHKLYDGYVQAQPDKDFNVTLLYDLTKLPDDIEDLSTKASMLRRNCYAAFFHKFFDIHKRMEKGESVEENCGLIHHHHQETMYIRASRDSVTVIISILYSNESDSILGKASLQQFEKIKSTIKISINTNEPPAELRGNKDALVGNNVAYITFVLFSRHTSPDARDNIIDRLHSFRDFFHHHIKETKAALHDSMRKKTVQYLKVLNRAKDYNAAVESKTFSGRTFKKNDPSNGFASQS